MDGDKAHFNGLRGMLALWILSGHMLLNEMFQGIYDAGFARHSDFGRFGDLIALRFLGVDLFFMLTGLVLTRRYYSHFNEATTGGQIDRFFLHRLAAVWPLHAAMVVVIGLYHLLGIPHPLSSGLQGPIFEHWPWTLGLNLVLMTAWGMIPVASWNEPSWSLSITFLIYLVFPNLLLILKRLPARLSIYSALIVFCIGGYAVLRATVLYGSQSDGAGAIARGLVFASVGCLTALADRVMPNAWFRRYGAWMPIGFFALVLLWTYGVQFDLTLFHFTYPLLLLGLMHGSTRILPLPIARFLGTRSFAVFMTHYPTLLLLRYLLGETLHDLAATGIALRAFCYVMVVATCLAIADIAFRANGWASRRLRMRLT